VVIIGNIWVHNGIGSVAQDTSIYKSGSESVKISGMSQRHSLLQLSKSGTTNIGEGMLVTWVRLNNNITPIIILVRSKTSKGYESGGEPKDCYMIKLFSGDGALYKYINGSSNFITHINGHGLSANVWYLLRVKWYKDENGYLVFVVDKSSDGSSWTNLGVATDPSPSFEGDTERKVGVGLYDAYTIWYDLTKVYKA